MKLVPVTIIGMINWVTFLFQFFFLFSFSTCLLHRFFKKKLVELKGILDRSMLWLLILTEEGYCSHLFLSFHMFVYLQTNPCPSKWVWLWRTSLTNLTSTRVKKNMKEFIFNEHDNQCMVCFWICWGCFFLLWHLCRKLGRYGCINRWQEIVTCFLQIGK